MGGREKCYQMATNGCERTFSTWIYKFTFENDSKKWNEQGRLSSGGVRSKSLHQLRKLTSSSGKRGSSESSFDYDDFGYDSTEKP